MIPHDSKIEQRDLETIRAIYRENHGTDDERMEVIRERCKKAGYPVNTPEGKAG
jgi:hypothetical protein